MLLRNAAIVARYVVPSDHFDGHQVDDKERRKEGPHHHVGDAHL